MFCGIFGIFGICECGLYYVKNIIFLYFNYQTSYVSPRPRMAFWISDIKGTSDLVSNANKKESVYNYLNNPFNRILKISLRSRYRALDPFFWTKPGS